MVRPLIVTFALAVVVGCTTLPKSRQDALLSEERRAVMTNCMAEFVDSVQEMAGIDPTYHYRRCRAEVNARYPQTVR